MGKRHQDALTISPSGIAHSILDACREIRAEPGHMGTAQLCADPALRLMVHQLAYITGIVVFEQDSHAYGRALDECRTLLPMRGRNTHRGRCDEGHRYTAQDAHTLLALHASALHAVEVRGALVRRQDQTVLVLQGQTRGGWRSGPAGLLRGVAKPCERFSGSRWCMVDQEPQCAHPGGHSGCLDHAPGDGRRLQPSDGQLGIPRVERNEHRSPRMRYYG